MITKPAHSVQRRNNVTRKWRKAIPTIADRRNTHAHQQKGQSFKENIDALSK